MTKFSDLIIVGSGPAGLSAAVNAASEGLSVIVVESELHVGGQAKQSSRIENYLGFPNGLTGPQLMNRASNQAKRFGAKFITGVSAVKLGIEGKFRTIELSNGDVLISNSVLLANGLQWRKLNAPGIEEYLGKGVFYGLDMSRAFEQKDKQVTVIGGANSAGQAAMYLSDFAKSVNVLVRSKTLEASKYLADRLTANSNIVIHYQAELASARGNGEQLTGITIALASGNLELPMDAIFVFVGASPRTTWLENVCNLDEQGYLLTTDFQTSCPGVFAIGDIRAGSVKRIASAVGEGSAVISRIHAYLVTL